MQHNGQKKRMAKAGDQVNKTWNGARTHHFHPPVVDPPHNRMGTAPAFNMLGVIGPLLEVEIQVLASQLPIAEAEL